MGSLRRLIGGFRGLVHKHRMEDDLDEELRSYLEASIDQKVRGGMTRESATRVARAEMGSFAAVKDHTRDVGWEAGFESLWRDTRYAARTLRRSPTFSAAAVLTLAIGIGANTAIFSAINAVMLRPLPVERPHELVSLRTVYPTGTDSVFSYAAFRQFVDDAADVVETFAASNTRRDAVAIDGPPEPVDLKWVSGNYFSALGVEAATGRRVLPADDRLPSGEPVVVLSDAYWTRRFGRDPSAIGRTFRLRGVPFTIVGVAPRGFFGESPGEAPDVWMPLTTQPGAPAFLWSGHSTTWLRILARRRPGVAFEEAHASLELVYGRVRDEVAAGTDSVEFRQTVLASRLAVSDGTHGSSTLRDQLSAPLLILMGIVALVLGMACANVANLMLARAAARRREAAVCLAIGASRFRVVRQGLVEAMLLAALGGIGGLLLASWGAAALMALVSSAWPVALDLGPDVRVLAFAALVSCATAFIFGLGPALRAARIDALPALKTGGTSAHAAARSGVGRALVVMQIAVSLVLLVAAGLFVRSLTKLQAIDPGFDPERVLVFEVAPSGTAAPPSREEIRHLYGLLLARAESVPGVEAASGSFSGVLGRGSWGNAIAIDGYVPPSGVTPRTLANAVTPRYFEVLRIAIVGGRGFSDGEHERATRVAVVSQTFARQFFDGQDPIGRRVGLCSSDPCGTPPMMEIVGVAEDAKYADLREERRPMLYVPFAQHAQPLQIEVRTTAAPQAVAPTLYRELGSVDSRLAIVRMVELRDRVDASLVVERLIARLSAMFGLIALVLAVVGLYGVTAYLAAGRTAEIGVRMALGADRGAVRWLVLRDTLTMIVVGLGIGIPAALVAARLLASQLYDVSPDDALVVSTSVTALSMMAILAGYVPARRASRIDPVVALRTE